MRAAMLIPALCLLAACNREKSFDERFEAARRQVDATSGRIDADLKARASAAAEASDPAPPASEGPVI
ncbi:hypothetical protein [Novosphingobium album (ex Liu et al. 2023)]|uniref:Lipoprotein n=1 Tax=Novosphingobium album (ex Liu et al. 2023) TaxID=3031130 RepID=A0ABT5WUS4_9SPHN|nr:hypothetical protein [Novosphingobium album (ex Liu et al. 2023)]MDE8653609.1 hypothetical protein [Novosphingobium album (ex Liu et al. 2023)]